jgi:hypothetical protein
MNKLIGSAAACAALLCVAAVSSTANAESISVVAIVSDSHTIITQNPQTNPSVISGTESTVSPNSMTVPNDYIEFIVTPTQVGDVSLTVGLIGGYSSLGFDLTTSPGGAVLATGSAGSVIPVSLVGSTDYYLELFSTGGGTGTWGIDINGGAAGTTPLPGALALFAGGLGLFGFVGLRKGRKGRRALTSVAAAA